MRRCSSIASMKKLFTTLVCIWGRGCLKKIPGVTRGCLVITPPRMLRISRNSSSEEFFCGLTCFPRPKKKVFYIISFYCCTFGSFSRLKNCSLRCLSYIIALNRLFHKIKPACCLAVTTYTKRKKAKKGKKSKKRRCWGRRE